MSHKNSDIEKSLNASSVLIELVKYEKTRSIFFEDESRMIAKMIDLAIDPSNSANQQYLLEILLEICKQFAPEAPAMQHAFEEVASAAKFDLETVKSQQQLALLEQVKDSDFFYNLMILIN